MCDFVHHGILNMMYVFTLTFVIEGCIPSYILYPEHLFSEG